MRTLPVLLGLLGVGLLGLAWMVQPWLFPRPRCRACGRRVQFQRDSGLDYWACRHCGVGAFVGPRRRRRGHYWRRLLRGHIAW